MSAARTIRRLGASIVKAGVDGVVSVWTKPSKSTIHLPGAEAADLEDDDPRLVRALSESDLYISPGIRPTGLSSAQAGKQNELVGLFAFGLDVDAASPLRAKANLPTSLEDVAAIIEACPFEPSMVVRSGTGNSLHGWWIFDRLEVIQNEADLTRLKRASKRFHEIFHERAAAMGFHLDATHKLNQWLRLPGSKNRKNPDHPQDVEIIFAGREYAFDEIFPDGRKVSSPVSEKYDAIEEVVEALRRSAKRIRPDHKYRVPIDDILAGRSFAESGDRDVAMFTTLSTIVFSLDRRNPLFNDHDRLGEALVRLYTPSFEVWAAETSATKTLEDRIEKFSQKIVDVFEQRAEKDVEREARRVQDTQQVAKGLRLGGKEIEPDEVVSADLLEHLAILQKGSAFWIWNFGKQDDFAMAPGYQGPITKDEIFLRAKDAWQNAPDSFRLTYLVEKKVDGEMIEVEKNKTDKQLALEYGTAIHEVIGHLALEESHFDVETRVFHEALCPLRKLEPRYDETFDEYLRVAFGDRYEKFNDWLAYLPQNHVPIAAPYLEGPPSTGKSALADGLSRLWGETGPSSYERSAAEKHNTFDNPFFVLDEGLTSINKTTSASIRNLIASGEHTINPKGLPQYKVVDYVRVMITANNSNVYAQLSNEELSGYDVDAIAQRFIHFMIRPEAADWLTERNEGRKLTDTWVKGDLMARHVLWLAETRAVVPGKRFIVEGEPSEIHRALVTRGDKRGIVLEWLARYLTDPKKFDQTQSKEEKTAIVGNGKLLVNTQAIVNGWALYREPEQKLTPTAIGKILGQLSNGKVNPGGRGSSRTKYHDVRIEHVFDFAEGDAQVGDVWKMRENLNAGVDP